MFSTNHFHYGITQSIGDTAIAATLTAARWGVLGFDWYTDTFFSPAAARRYRAIGQCIGFAAVVAVALGMTVRIYLQSWVDSEVEGALPDDHIVEANEMVDPFAPEVNPLPVSEDMSNSLEVSGLETLTIRQLKASARGKVPGYGRMTKGQLVTALAGV